MSFSREALRSYGRSFQLISPIESSGGAEAALASPAGRGPLGFGDRRVSFAFSAAAPPFVSVSGALAGSPGGATEPGAAARASLPAVASPPPPPAEQCPPRNPAQGGSLILSTNPLLWAACAPGGLPEAPASAHVHGPPEERAGVSLPPAALGLPLEPPPFSQASPGARTPGGFSDRFRTLEASPVSVRRTFVDFPLARSPSLESFFDERLVRSSPVSRPISGPTSGAQSRVRSPMSRQTSGGLEPVTLCPRELESFLSIAVTPTSSRMPSPRGELAPAAECGAQAQQAWPWVAASAAPDAPMVLRLSDAIDKMGLSGASSGSATCSTRAGSGAVPLSPTPQVESGLAPGTALSASGADRPTLGTPELPSRGSALHCWGACKPCAFVFAEGCANGVDCQFCHLCDAGEKKRRRRERRKVAAAVSRPR